MTLLKNVLADTLLDFLIKFKYLHKKKKKIIKTNLNNLIKGNWRIIEMLPRSLAEARSL